eukprot:5637660-Ditylum_brightwellii.AAC.1
MQLDAFKLSSDTNTSLVDVAYAFQWTLSALMQNQSSIVYDILVKSAYDETDGKFEEELIKADIQRVMDMNIFETADIFSALPSYSVINAD